MGKCIWKKRKKKGGKFINDSRFRIASSGQLAKPDQIRLDSLKAEASKIERAKKVACLYIYKIMGGYWY